MVVFFEEYSRKALAAVAIVIAHVLVLYLLALAAPAVEQVMANSPITVHFISQSEPPPQWQPPRVAMQTPEIYASVPQVPVIETAATPVEIERAITAVAVQSPVPSARQDSAPRVISAVEYVRQPAPRYPPQSRRLKEQGLVVLRVLIDEQGSARSIEIENSSGYARLDHAAREAVSRAAFRPYVEDGEPRRVLVLIPIEFALNRSAA